MTLAALTRRALAAAQLAAAFAASSNVASAAQPRQGLEIPSALVIAKSTNRNEVHYAVRVDETCAPGGTRPVSPYWRMLERGPDVTESLSDSEQRVLGVERQEVTAAGILLVLRGLPGRTLTIHTWRGSDGRCASSVDTTVAGVTARVASVYVKQRFLGVDYVLLTGVSQEGTVVQERVAP
jgi:hypothetical protein